MVYFLQKIIDVKKKDKIHDTQLFVIINNFCSWRHNLKQVYYIIEILIDHNNLQKFMNT